MRVARQRQRLTVNLSKCSAMAVQCNMCVCAMRAVRALRRRALPPVLVVRHRTTCGVLCLGWYMCASLRGRAGKGGKGRGTRRRTHANRELRLSARRPRLQALVTRLTRIQISNTGAMHAFSTTARLTVPHRAQQNSSVSVSHLSRGFMCHGGQKPTIHLIRSRSRFARTPSGRHHPGNGLKRRLTRTHRASSFLGPRRP